MITLNRAALAAGICLLALGSACGFTDEKRIDIGTQLEGEKCSQVSDCQAGFTCRTNAELMKKVCTALDPFPEDLRGTTCASDMDCGALKCSNSKVCTDVPLRAAGEACGLTADCTPPNICLGSGICGADDAGPGTVGEGGLCIVPADCRRPFVCGLDFKCQKLPFFPGVSCFRSDEERGAFRAYWEVPQGEYAMEGSDCGPTTTCPGSLVCVPRTGVTDGSGTCLGWDFYRLPFPSEVRRSADNKLDLSGHPSPGKVLGIDVAGTYIKSIQEDVDGWAPNGSIIFRFSDRVQQETLVIAGETPTVYLVNIEKTSANYKKKVPVQMAYSLEKGQYICQNWLAIGPLDGVPLDPGTTYAAIVTTDVRSVRGEMPIRDCDLEFVLGHETPVYCPDPSMDTALPTAKERMAPLLTYLADAGIDAKKLASATVFKTGNPTVIAGKLRQAVYAAAEPTVTSAQLSAEDATEIVDVVTGVYTAPIFQKGARPYLEPGDAGDNGAMVLGADGLPTVHGTENMRFAMSVPKDATPVSGSCLPVAIYAHGTGGDFKTFLGAGDRIGDLLGDVKDDAGNPLARMAVISFDNVMHGPRQGFAEGMEKDPGGLFFNILNARAARDNVLQGSADLFTLVRLVRGPALQNAIRTALGKPEVCFDPDRVVFFGHSQGTVISPPFLAAETEVKAVVLSGAGGELTLSILNKKKPTDLSTAAKTALGDQNLARLHPMLGVLSLLFGSTESVNYGKRIFASRPDPTGTMRPPASLMQTYGINDNYAPEPTQEALIRSMGIPFVAPSAKQLPGIPEVAAPVVSNVAVDGTTVTGAALMLNPDPARCGDGHFVATCMPEGRRAVARFLGSAAAGRPAPVQR